MTIRFCDIDTNRNGYLEQKEIDHAHKIGVKRELYIGMRSSDIKKNITREEKLSMIINANIRALASQGAPINKDLVFDIYKESKNIPKQYCQKRDKNNSIQKRMEDELLEYFAKFENALKKLAPVEKMVNNLDKDKNNDTDKDNLFDRFLSFIGWNSNTAEYKTTAEDLYVENYDLYKDVDIYRDKMKDAFKYLMKKFDPDWENHSLQLHQKSAV